MKGSFSRGTLAILLIVAVLVIVYVPVSAQSTEQRNIMNQMINAMEKTGSRATNVELRASIPREKVQNQQEWLEIGKQWDRTVSIMEMSRFYQDQDKLVYESKGMVGTASLHSKLIGLQDKKGISAYLVISINGRPDQIQDIEKIHQLVMKSSKKYDMIPQFSTCIHGIYSDTLGDGYQEEEIIASILQTLDAKRIEALQDESVISVSAFTKNWSPFITTNTQKMNLQVATHVDVKHNETRITLGTPIITAEY